MAGVRSWRGWWAECHWWDLIEKGSFTDSGIQIVCPLANELTVVQAKFAQKVSGRVGIKPHWLDSQFRTTAPTQREVRTRAEEWMARGSAELPGRGGALCVRLGQKRSRGAPGRGDSVQGGPPK